MIKNGPKYAEGIPVDEVHVSLLSVQAARSSEGNLYTIQNSDFVIVGRIKQYWKFQRFWLIFGACFNSPVFQHCYCLILSYTLSL